MSRLQFAALAREDLLGIAHFIVLDNPVRARSFVAELRKQCTLLAERPELGIVLTFKRLTSIQLSRRNPVRWVLSRWDCMP